MSKDELLKGFDLILKSHEVGDRLVTNQKEWPISVQLLVEDGHLHYPPFIRIINVFQRDIFLILE
jgi:hypothetical protein